MDKEFTMKQDLEELDKCIKIYDTEHAHVVADEILLKYVPAQIREKWEEVPKWYS